MKSLDASDPVSLEDFLNIMKGTPLSVASNPTEYIEQLVKKMEKDQETRQMVEKVKNTDH